MNGKSYDESFATKFPFDLNNQVSKFSCFSETKYLKGFEAFLSNDSSRYSLYFYLFILFFFQFYHFKHNYATIYVSYLTFSIPLNI